MRAHMNAHANLHPGVVAPALPTHLSPINPSTGSAAHMAAERVLMEAAERALRAPRGKVALVLHLCRLKPPAPRPHHIRIARALMEDTAQRYGGQVFPLRNGDLALICAAPGDEAHGLIGQVSPAALPATFMRLFGASAPEDGRLTTLWRLEEQAEQFRAFVMHLRDQLAHAPPNDATGDEGSFSIAGLLPLEARVATASVPDLLAQQVAIHLQPGRHLPLTARLAPLYRELTVVRGALAGQHEDADALADPYLFRHFAAGMDTRLLGYLRQDLEHGGQLTRGALRQKLPLHLNLTLQSIVSPEFARLADTARRTGGKFGVEVSIMEAAADSAMMDHARRLLDTAGFPLVVDELDHVALTMTNPAGLRPALVKLTWSPRLADAPPPVKAAIEAALARIGPERLVLQHAESEAALLWGQVHGIMRFQGYYLDAVQAAARIAGCHSARACTLRQCITRAASLSPQVRVGCGNPGLLDMAPDFRAAETAASSSHASSQTSPHAPRRAS
jgi:EAL domain-containing protein (putative c-di-GMP-specific phosphodiesterase class I)